VLSQLDPELQEHVMCNFATDPPSYTTDFAHPLGDAAGIP